MILHFGHLKHSSCIMVEQVGQISRVIARIDLSEEGSDKAQTG